MKKLYSVRNRKLVEANVVRETPLYYFVDTAELTNWGKRLKKSEVDGSPRFGRSSPPPRRVPGRRRERGPEQGLPGAGRAPGRAARAGSNPRRERRGHAGATTTTTWSPR